MDIIIKSFNRPYYLERCLRSVFEYVSGDYKVTIIDDGTAQHYLEKIQNLFPEVTLVRSKDYAEKERAIADHLAGNSNYSIRTIPTLSWIQCVEKSSDTFLMLEEDSWFNTPLDLDKLRQVFELNKLVTLKLAWNSNDKLVQGKQVQLSPDVEEIIPALPLKSHAIMTPLLRDFLRIRTVATRLGILRPTAMSPYYSLYSVTSSLYDREYWLYIWKKASPYVDEKQQLLRALKWMNNHSDSRYAKLLHECIRTSFLTSSVNSFNPVPFDMIRMNSILSDAWMKGRFDVMENFPDDLPIARVQKFVDDANDPHCTSSVWIKWVDAFKRQHLQTV